MGFKHQIMSVFNYLTIIIKLTLVISDSKKNVFI